jgi:flagellar biosynthesis protein FlhA
MDPIELRLGTAVAAGFRERSLDLADRIAVFRKQFALEQGFVLPRVQIHLDRPVGDHGYEIFVQGSRAG